MTNRGQIRTRTSATDVERRSRTWMMAGGMLLMLVLVVGGHLYRSAGVRMRRARASTWRRRRHHWLMMVRTVVHHGVHSGQLVQKIVLLGVARRAELADLRLTLDQHLRQLVVELQSTHQRLR